MMDYARQRTIEALKTACTTVLATSGPAGILESEHPCEALGLVLYLVLPGTSDHLFNLEQDRRVALLTDEWGLRGVGRVLSSAETQPELKRLQPLLNDWYVLVKILPTQIQVRRRDGWGDVETIDLEVPESS